MRLTPSEISGLVAAAIGLAGAAAAWLRAAAREKAHERIFHTTVPAPMPPSSSTTSELIDEEAARQQ